MPFHVPEEEMLEPGRLERLQRAKLERMMRFVMEVNPFYRGKFAGIGFDPLVDPLDRLPFTTREEVQQDQIEHPPYGTLHAAGGEAYVRLHQTSGTTGAPLRWLDTQRSWSWWRRCWSIVYRGAGVEAKDRVFFPFSFGPFIGFWAAFEAAGALGCMVLPVGGLTTRARLSFLLDNHATVVCCTPTYAFRLAEVAQEAGYDLASSDVRLLIVAGEPGGSDPGLRGRMEGVWGARVIDHAGMTEAGAWGFECVEAAGGMHVIESEFIAELVDPASDRVLADGDGEEEGELVLTNLGRWGSPLIRYRTGDQVRMSRRPCACGRWFSRFEGGIIGRRDDMLVVRGNNVFPSVMESLVRGFPEVAEMRIIVNRRAALADLRIEIEPAGQADSGALCDRIAEAIRDRLHFRPRVLCVPQGSLPRFEMKARRVVVEE